MKGDHATYHSSLSWSSSWKRARLLFHKMPCTQSTDPRSSSPPHLTPNHAHFLSGRAWPALICHFPLHLSTQWSWPVLTTYFLLLSVPAQKRCVGPLFPVTGVTEVTWSLRCLACMHVKLMPSCLILCNPMDCSPPGSSVHGLSRREYWRGLLCPSPGDLPNLGIEPSSLMYPAQAGGFLTTSATWEAPY